MLLPGPISVSEQFAALSAGALWAPTGMGASPKWTQGPPGTGAPAGA